jgi:Uma2 family endonuclease
MSTVAKRLLSPEEYLARERVADFRSEYYRGEMFAMAGASPQHSLICANMIRQLGNALEGRPCAVYTSDLRVRVSVTGLYTYPDVSVVCGPLEFDDKHRDTVLNPTLIVEVLSEGTEAYDRGKKFRHYQRLASLREYVLVSQDQPQVERFMRNPDDTWTLTTVSGLDQSLELPSIGVTLSLAAVYGKVDFTSVSAPPAEPPA